MQREDGTWRQVASYKVLKKSGTQSLRAYIDRRQATVAGWVALCPILEVCDREMGYEGGGRCREPWWRQTAARKHMSVMLKEISAASREKRWESGRCGGGGGDRDAVDS